MFKIETPLLQEMVNKLSKCTGNKLLEITNYYEINVDERGLVINATDGNNFITVINSATKGEKLKTIVKADHFAKLVTRTTATHMIFTLKENYLEVIGNGKYKLEIVEGETYPTYTFEPTHTEEINLVPLKASIGVNKHSVSQNISDGVLTGYYLSNNKMITADGIRVCVTEANIGEANLLLSRDFINLIGALTDEKGTLEMDSNGAVKISTSNAIIFGSEMEGKEEYPDVLPLTEIQFESSCSLSKLAILAILERLNLFINPFEKNETKLIFEENCLKIETLTGSYETVAYSSVNNYQPYSCSINGLFFKDLVTAVKTELFDLHFGEEVLIRLETPDSTQLLATGEEQA